MPELFLPFVTSNSPQQYQLKVTIEKVDGDRLDISFGPDTNEINMLGYASVKLTKNLTLALALVEELSSQGMNMQGKPGIYKDPTEYGLTPRQIEILQLSSEGFSYSEIAQKLNISPKTVRNMMADTCSGPCAFDRLNVNGLAHAVAESLRRGLIK